VTPDNGLPLASGGSQAEFSLLLPGDARCPGDSTSAPWWEADSYLVPRGTSPASVDFKTYIPSPGLFLRAWGAPFEGITVGKGDSRVQLPDSFDFDTFKRGNLLPGGTAAATWEMGIACADDKGDVAGYWNAEVTFTASSTDPNGWVWHVDKNDPLPAPSSRWVLLVGIVAVCAGAALAVWGVRQRRRDHRTTERAGR
jgi:hypothetical protein